ncbi:hypothetical protein Purlil1_6745 [Purpureocillium lilacinum]|uniref:Velvet domain-containing protein n=2 Tax=Purpureocillium lilacinum TaxID=33203 RepID=A0ABR0BXV4_PURLI|nr:hypothetical protein Purlil1_6745 [Purpureocillium lilacinum]
MGLGGAMLLALALASTRCASVSQLGAHGSRKCGATGHNVRSGTYTCTHSTEVFMSTPLGILGRRNADTTRPAPSGFGCQPSPPAGQPSRPPTTLANLPWIKELVRALASSPLQPRPGLATASRTCTGQISPTSPAPDNLLLIGCGDQPTQPCHPGSLINHVLLRRSAVLGPAARWGSHLPIPNEFHVPYAPFASCKGGSWDCLMRNNRTADGMLLGQLCPPVPTQSRAGDTTRLGSRRLCPDWSTAYHIESPSPSFWGRHVASRLPDPSLNQTIYVGAPPPGCQTRPDADSTARQGYSTEIAPFGLGHPRRRPATRERNLSGQPAHPVPSFSTRTQTDVFSFWNLEPSSTVPPIPGGSVVVPCRRWGRGTFAPSQSRSLTCLPPPQGLSPTLAWPARSPEAALRACLLARLPAICLVARCVGGDELPLLPPPPARGTTTQDHRTAPLGGVDQSRSAAGRALQRTADSSFGLVVSEGAQRTHTHILQAARMMLVLSGTPFLANSRSIRPSFPEDDDQLETVQGAHHASLCLRVSAWACKLDQRSRPDLTMAGNAGNYLDLPFLQPGRHASTFQYLGGGELPLAADDPQQSPQQQHLHHQQQQQQQHYKFQGDPQRQLTLRQAPMHARVAIGKEKDRKPIDPPPIVQLLDKRHDGKSGLYDSPYLFMTSMLVPETYGEASNDQDVPSNYLVGSLASSIHRLRDTDNVEGGFFVFGDLSVKREGRFRLLFTLYERDHHSSMPSFNYVSELVTNVFTVYPTKLFPGMADSTPLTRTFSDQGVKVRLRKDSSGMAARKRNRSATEATDNYLERQPKRSSYDRDLPLSSSNYSLSTDLSHMDPMGGSHGVVSSAPPSDFINAPDALSTTRSAGMDLQLSTSGYYFAGPQYY